MIGLSLLCFQNKTCQSVFQKYVDNNNNIQDNFGHNDRDVKFLYRYISMCHLVSNTPPFRWALPSLSITSHNRF